MDRGVAQVLNTLAGVLVDLGGRERLTEAEAYLRRSLALGEKLQDERHVAQVLNTLAGVLVDLGRPGAADGGRGLPAPQSRAGREAAR